MDTYSRQEAADRAGVSVEELGRLVELGILDPAEAERLTKGDVRKADLVQSQAVVEASEEPGVTYTDIGQVELKGVGGAIHLHSAHRS